MIYIASAKPMTDRSLNILENVNEVFVGHLAILYVVFTEYCPEAHV